MRRRRLESITTEYHGSTSPTPADLEGERNKANVSMARHRSIRQMLLAEIGNVDDMLGVRKRRDSEEFLEADIAADVQSPRRARRFPQTTESASERRWRSSERSPAKSERASSPLPIRAQYKSIEDTLQPVSPVDGGEETGSESISELLRLLRDAKAAVHSIPISSCRPKDDALQLLTASLQSLKNLKLTHDSTQPQHTEVEPPKGEITVVSLLANNAHLRWRTSGDKPSVQSEIKSWAKIARKKISRQGGWEIECGFDEIRAAFQSPLKAVSWGVTCLQSPGLPKCFSYSIGIERGTPLSSVDPITGKQNYYGPVVSSASILAAKAGDGELLTTRQVLRSVGELSALSLQVKEVPKMRLHNQPLYTVSRKNSAGKETVYRHDDIRHIIRTLSTGRTVRGKTKGLVEWLEEHTSEVDRNILTIQEAVGRCQDVPICPVTDPDGKTVYLSVFLMGTASLWFENTAKVAKAVTSLAEGIDTVAAKHSGSVLSCTVSSSLVSFPDMPCLLEAAKLLHHITIEAHHAVSLSVFSSIQDCEDSPKITSHSTDGLIIQSHIADSHLTILSKSGWYVAKSKMEGFKSATSKTGWKQVLKSDDGANIEDYWAAMMGVLERRRSEIKAGERVLLHCKAGCINSSPPQGSVVLGYIDLQSKVIDTSITVSVKETLSLFTHKVRSLLVQHDGYEALAEADGFFVAFKDAKSAVSLAGSIQTALEATQSSHLRIRVALHKCTPVCEKDPITGRMDYYGPDLSILKEISTLGRPGEIVVSGPTLSSIDVAKQGFIQSHLPSVTVSGKPDIPVVSLLPISVKDRVLSDVHKISNPLREWWMDETERDSKEVSANIEDISSNVAIIIRTVHNYASQAAAERGKMKESDLFNEKVISLARSVAKNIRTAITKNTSFFDLDVRYTAFLDETLAIPDIQEEDKDKKYLRQNTLTKFKVAALSVGRRKSDPSGGERIEDVKSELFKLHRMVQSFFLLIKPFMASIDPFISREMLSEPEFIEAWVRSQNLTRGDTIQEGESYGQQFVLQTEKALEDPALQPSTWVTVSRHVTALCNKHFLLLKQSLKRVHLQKQNLQRRVSCVPPPMVPLSPG